jgi:lipopolysaccharide/colanic/teichoic acid biosynthesis glycosyltransferase
MPGISSSEEFHENLERERARADRSGRAFSVVSFNIGNHAGEDLTRRLARAINLRKRRVDGAGWIDDGRLGVILPETVPAGAWRLAEDAWKELGGAYGPLPCEVYAYPAPPPDPDGAGDKPRARPLVDLISGPPPLWKRLIDIVAASLCLVILSPLLLGVCILIKATSKGPVLFRQSRLGYMGKPFTMLKFRTMEVDPDESMHRSYLKDLIQGDAPMAKLDSGNDRRIIPMGRFLRAACLDELPQLINVLCGEMSLVGPRPCIPYEASEYLPWQHRRFDSVPGMTGLWQVSGKNRTTFKEMIRLDINYSRKFSPWTDVGILLKTVPAIVGQYVFGAAKGKALKKGEIVHAGPGNA